MNESALHETLDDNAAVHAIYAELVQDFTASGIHEGLGESALRLCLELKDSASPAFGMAAVDLHQAISSLRQFFIDKPDKALLQNRLGGALRESVQALGNSALDWPQRRYLMTYVQVLQLTGSLLSSAGIPKIIHFLKTDADRRHINPFNYLSIKSAIHHCPDYRIVFHTPVRPEGPLWEELLPHMELNLGIPPQTLGEHRLEEAAHQADVWRAEKLLQYGGFYFDWDLVLLRPPTDLLNNVCVMGAEGLVPQHKEVLGVSAIGAQPGSPFLQCWLNGMVQVYDPGHYVNHSTVLAREIAIAFPASVRVLPSKSYYYPGWTREAMAWLFEPDEELGSEELERALEGSWGIHLFESHENFLHYAKGLTLDDLRDMRCNFTNIIKPLLP